MVIGSGGSGECGIVVVVVLMFVVVVSGSADGE